jgi:hypothetical protein
MYRFAAVLLCCCSLLTAAPPPPKAWVTGWNQPVDPLGDCRFDRSGDKLVISVPGKPRYFMPNRRPPKAPHLDLWQRPLRVPMQMRSVEGDFTVQLRVGGNAPGDGQGLRRAGILLVSGRSGAALSLELPGDKWLAGKCHIGRTMFGSVVGWGMGGEDTSVAVAIPGRRPYLCLERRGQTLVMKYSKDGKDWETWHEGGWAWWLGRKVEVGVYAEAVAEGTFAAVFDEFKLTPLGRRP